MKRNILVLISLSAMLVSVNAFAGDDDSKPSDSASTAAPAAAPASADASPAAPVAADAAPEQEESVEAGAKKMGSGVSMMASDIGTYSLGVGSQLGSDIKGGALKVGREAKVHIISPVENGTEVVAIKTGDFFKDPYSEAFAERAKPGFVADTKAVAKGTEVLLENTGKDLWHGILAIGHMFHRAEVATANHFKDRIAKKKEDKRLKKQAKAKQKEALTEANAPKDQATLPAQAVASTSEGASKDVAVAVPAADTSTASSDVAVPNKAN